MMLSIIILTNKIVDDAYARQQALQELLTKYNIKYSTTYISTPSYNGLQDIKGIVAQYEKLNLIVLSDDTNKNAQIYVGLDSAKGDNALILGIDTNIDIIEQILQKYKDGCENVFVRPKKNGIYSFFTKLGMLTYGLGLKMLKKLPDLCCDSSVMLLNKMSIEAILNNPQHQKEMLNTNLTPEEKYAVIEQKHIHDSPTINQQRFQTPFFSLGILSLIFVIITLAAMLVYPMFNGWVYSLWMFITIVLWLALSVAACAIISKQIFNSRQGVPIPLDVDGYPLIQVNSTFTYSDLYQQKEFMQYYSAQEDTDKKEKKQKTNKTKKEPSTKTKKAQTTKQTKTTTKKTDKNEQTTTPKKRGRPPKQK